VVRIIFYIRTALYIYSTRVDYKRRTSSYVCSVATKVPSHFVSITCCMQALKIVVTYIIFLLKFSRCSAI